MNLIQPVRLSQSTENSPHRRLLLVDPYPRNNPYHLTASERRAVWFPKLSLPVIAAYTPESWSVDLVDEAVQDVNFDHPCDLVGISVMTCIRSTRLRDCNGVQKAGEKSCVGRRPSHLLPGRSPAVL